MLPVAVFRSPWFPGASRLCVEDQAPSQQAEGLSSGGVDGEPGCQTQTGVKWMVEGFTGNKESGRVQRGVIS